MSGWQLEAGIQQARIRPINLSSWHTSCFSRSPREITENIPAMEHSNRWSQAIHKQAKETEKDQRAVQDEN